MDRLTENMELLSLEFADLQRSIREYAAAKKKNGGNKPPFGYGAEWKTDGYGTSYQIKEGLRQGSTHTAIERKIVAIRDHLNELRKLVNL